MKATIKNDNMYKIGDLYYKCSLTRKKPSVST